MKEEINVLIVEDSAVDFELLKKILSYDERLKVIGRAHNGEEAIDLVSETKPDIVLMDIHMPKMDGYEATKRIMETNPIPIVILSASGSSSDIDKTFQAISAGAVSFIPKPEGILHPNFESQKMNIVTTVKIMSEVKVVKRWNFKKETEKNQEKAEVQTDILKKNNQKIQIVAIGASTGGPTALQKIVSTLPKDFPVPIIIIQHIAQGFLYGFCDWLSTFTELKISIAKRSDILLPGNIYLAPDGFQTGISGNREIILTKDIPENNLRPSISYTFRSIAENFRSNSIGVLLTGMGADGAAGLKLMRDKGAITIAQDETSSMIYGMPREAVKLDAATYIVHIDKIANYLINILKNNE